MEGSLKNGIELEDRINIKIISMNWKKPKPKDTDEDVIIEIEDDCPNLAGIAKNNCFTVITEETYKLKISEHADNQGDDDADLLLSYKRV